jgi:hypothetical protein
MSDQLTCATCKHFKNKQTQPDNLKVRSGECRALPPPSGMIVNNRGQGNLVCPGIYARLSDQTPACGMYQAGIEVVEGG